MARVTVEDCILNIPSRFELVVIAAQRAKQIASGNPLTIDRDNDKDAVVSLREIAEKTVDIDKLQEDMVQSFCKKHLQDLVETAQLEEKQSSEEIEDAFEEAKQHINVLPASNAGLSFEDENVKAED